MNPNVSQPLPALSTGEIREILATRIDRQKQAVGIVVGIVDPNGRRVVAHGNLASNDPRPVDVGTIFEIGSITKVFTSLLLADMVNRKEVGLRDPAASYLPENITMPERNGKSITLLDLATHTSGLPRVPGNMTWNDLRNPYADYTADDLYEFLSGYELPRDPASEFEYSNLGAGLLGHLLALHAGTDYESLIKTRITQPLEMPDTGVTLSASMRRRMATGHTAMLAPTANWDFPTLAGAGALRSSANDMLTFLEAILGYRESPLAPAMKAMFEVRRSIGETKAEIGLAWHLLGDSAWHAGGTGGFRSFLGCDLKARFGIVVLSNASTPAGVEDIGAHIWNPNVPLANPEPPKQHTEIPIDPNLLDRYTGRYQVSPNLVFEITRDGDRLFAQGFAQVPGQTLALPKYELFAEGEKSFFAKVADQQMVFEAGPDGRATSLIMHRAGQTHAPGPRLP